MSCIISNLQYFNIIISNSFHLSLQHWNLLHQILVLNIIITKFGYNILAFLLRQKIALWNPTFQNVVYRQDMSPSVRNMNIRSTNAKTAITTNNLPIFFFHDIILDFLINKICSIAGMMLPVAKCTSSR